MKQIRVATIGSNFIVERFLSAAKSCNDIIWTAAYSRTLETGKKFIGDAKNVVVYDSLEALAASDIVDAVYIASPTSCHSKQAIQMLKAGKHVFCEKPIASNLKEWQAMNKTAKSSGKILLEAMRPLYTPGYQAIVNNLHKIAPVRLADFSFCKYSSRYDDFKKGIVKNAFRPEFSNGALMDIGVYPVESMVGLLGKPESVCGKATMLQDSIDGAGSIVAEYEGAVVTVSYSKISDSSKSCEIQGENGTILYDEPTAPENVRIVYRDKSEEMLFEKIEKDDMIYEIQAFADVINGKESSDKYNCITTTSLTVMDKVRSDCEIVFPADLNVSEEEIN